jgi:hypothetical protein
MKGIILIILNYFFDVIHQNRHFLRQLPEEKKNLGKNWHNYTYIKSNFSAGNN